MEFEAVLTATIIVPLQGEFDGNKHSRFYPDRTEEEDAEVESERIEVALRAEALTNADILTNGKITNVLVQEVREKIT